VERAEAEAIYDGGREVCVQFILDLAARVEQHEDRLRRLEEQAREDSGTSSKPPSSDPPRTRQQRRAEARAKAKELLREEGQRKAGGQPGHPGAGRELKPEDQVDEIVDHYPEACRGCGREFAVDERHPGSRVGRHQIAQLPPISVLLVEHRTHRLHCPGCGTRTTAQLPAGIGGQAFGPNLQAALVRFTARDRISRRGMIELASDLFGVDLSIGTVDRICQRAFEALAGPHAQLHHWVLDQAALHVDESGWRTAGDGRALWTLTTPGAALFQIAEHCNREHFQALIGRYPGIVVSDRWNGFEHLDPERRQVCWSHIERDFRRHSEGLAEQKTFGEQGLELTDRVFGAGRTFKHEHHDRDQLNAEGAPIQTEPRQLLQDASPKSRRTRWHRRFANNLLKVWPALWTFLTIESVEPTSNPAERALRGPVIHRKISHGTTKKEGERFAERAHSAAAIAACKTAYLRELLVAHGRGDPFPALT
jgi:transposase